MKRFDCHCHTFNIVSVGLRALLEQLQETSTLIEEDKKVPAGGAALPQAQSIIDKLKRLIELGKIFSGNNEKILSLLDGHYKGEYGLFPLMFDGDFLLESATEEERNQVNGIISSVRGYINEQNAVSTPGLISNTLSDVSHLHDLLDRVEKVVSGEKKDGFTIQYEELLAIKSNKKYKDKVFPFLGVDPRRDNITTFLPKVGKGQTFAGIKMYSPNGFSPTDPRLDAIYDYCRKNNIPVISHCSYGGFATPAMNIDVDGYILQPGNNEPIQYKGKVTFTKSIIDGFGVMVKERARMLNHPKIWRKVLEKHKGLLLVLAHFGSSNDPDCFDEWRNEIRDMMLEYNNLYTDISCTSDVGILDKVKSIYDDPQYSKLKNRVLYGSDYFLDMFFNNSFDEYYNRIQSVFTDGTFDQISIVNPGNFMNAWYKQS
jgi:predicted TIM-barrel fold metal-dependent hydrolase